MSKKIILTGITPSGTPHLGNYIGAIKPALEQAKDPNSQSFFFIADHHSLIKLWDAKARKQFIYEIAATWLAFGLNPDQVLFYRQSDIPEIMELNWILSTIAAKGLLNRAHAYKAAVDQNQQEGNTDLDAGITMGLFNYPVLMAADIVMFDADLVPVGKDQIQHVEIARDLANRLNHVYQKNVLTAPKALIDENTQTIVGLDGRKMSKSYNNTIPVFLTEKQLRKHIMKIVTNSQPPEEPKSTEGCSVFSLYQHFADADEVNALAQRYAQGIGWGEAKQTLFEKVNAVLTEPRERYNYLMENTAEIDAILAKGAEKARIHAQRKLLEVKKAVGLC